MKTVTPDKSLVYRELFVAQAAQEAAWRRYPDSRRKALDALIDTGLDTRGREEWVAGDAGGLRTGSVLPVNGPLPTDRNAELTSLALSHRLVFVNGVFDPRRSLIGELPVGVKIEPLSTAAEIADLGAVAGVGASAFVALNAVFWRDGLRLELPADVSLDRPVELHYVNELGGAAGLVPVRNVVRVGARSRLALVERHYLGNDAVVEQPLTEVICAEGAAVDHIKLVGGEPAGEHFGGTHVAQAADSRYRSWEILTGGRLTRREIHLDLRAPGASCDLNALYMGGTGQRFDLRTRVNHDAPDCVTTELYKGVLDGDARGVFDGMIKVARDSQRTSAHQTNRNLLLSDDAVVNSIPRLEIYADDVKCSHGSTTGQLDDNQLFYLRTRGFSTEEARTYLAWAFASEVIDSLPLPALRAELSALVTRTLDVVDTAVLGERDR